MGRVTQNASACTCGSFPFERLFLQIARIHKTDQLDTITYDVVKATASVPVTCWPHSPQTYHHTTRTPARISARPTGAARKTKRSAQMSNPG